MSSLISERTSEPWRRRLYVASYQLSEAAKYAQVSAKTVADWHRVGGRKDMTLSVRTKGEALSYLQLIEVAVVAAFRKMNVSLKRIRDARDYCAKVLEVEYPFAQYKFKTDGKGLLMDYEQVVGAKGKGTLLRPDQGGQLAWDAVIGRRLKEFEYVDGGVAIRWHLAGPKSPVVIDPRISFGAPTVSGTPTWIVRGRWEAGETIDDIAKDFDLNRTQVKKALAFEGVDPKQKRQQSWVN